MTEQPSQQHDVGSPKAKRSRLASVLFLSGWKLVPIGIAIVASLFTSYVVFTDCNSFKQRSNMRAAERHGDEHEARIRAMPGYADVRMMPFTGGHCGCMRVFGRMVPSVAAAEELRNVIAATNPPVEVIFHVEVFENDSIFQHPIKPIPKP